MGYDSNKKSLRSQQQQRLTIVLSAVSLCVVIFLIISLLGGDSSGGGSSGRSGATAPRGDHTVTASKLMRMRQAGLLQQGEADLRPAGDSSDPHPGTGLRRETGQKKSAGRVMMPPERKADQRKSADVGGSGQMPPVLSRMGTPEEQAAAKKQSDLDSEVRTIKATGIIMETDEHSLEVTGRLQDATRELIKLRYGDYGGELSNQIRPRVPADHTRLRREGEGRHARHRAGADKAHTRERVQLPRDRADLEEGCLPPERRSRPPGHVAVGGHEVHALPGVQQGVPPQEGHDRVRGTAIRAGVLRLHRGQQPESRPGKPAEEEPERGRLHHRHRHPGNGGRHGREDPHDARAGVHRGQEEVGLDKEDAHHGPRRKGGLRRVI
ncbi:hypothetical protein THAOC_37214 [Thalassiosira oceanica]|uniref:Uncharacterized protein n=1 Tax=Thalassiosira oceanica TaxID=159749 RepID=K0RCP6_THAOC|nr:hypothetical protein THAOC_37214 [Thalassiosira oceanica]|eukprot:EJK44262.1 hypothetical protein THAOC_37214 [Thalassiosira oceanica]